MGREGVEGGGGVRAYRFVKGPNPAHKAKASAAPGPNSSPEKGHASDARNRHHTGVQEGVIGLKAKKLPVGPRKKKKQKQNAVVVDPPFFSISSKRDQPRSRRNLSFFTGVYMLPLEKAERRFSVR